MPTTNTIQIPLQFNQLVELIKTLPPKKKRELMNVLEQDVPGAVPDWQKQEVRKRVKKYNKHPELLITEKQALKIINQA
jgi:hypothetical protein